MRLTKYNSVENNDILSSNSILSGTMVVSNGYNIVRSIPNDTTLGPCSLVDICGKKITDEFLHGFINMMDCNCYLHNIYVDPNDPNHGGHSHAVDNFGSWDSSDVEFCLRFVNLPCDMLEKIYQSSTFYEELNVKYSSPYGPNSNSFIEWILYESGFGPLESPDPRLLGWDYYQLNPNERQSPPIRE